MHWNFVKVCIIGAFCRSQISQNLVQWLRKWRNPRSAEAILRKKESYTCKFANKIQTKKKQTGNIMGKSWNFVIVDKWEPWQGLVITMNVKRLLPPPPPTTKFVHVPACKVRTWDGVTTDWKELKITAKPM